MFVEAEANKAASKFDNASIDFQVEFYKKEGLTPYSAAKLPITSGNDVKPPFSNLFHKSEIDIFSSLNIVAYYFTCRCS